MPIIALVGNKGGAGKTSLCINLAAVLAQSGSCVILDADPQLSSFQWHALTESEPAAEVIDAVDTLDAELESASTRYDNVLIDCPPSVHSPQTPIALARADIALIPVQPSPLDLWASVHIEQAIDEAKTLNPGLRPFLVINQLEPRTKLSQLMREALDELALPAAESAIRRRMAFRTSLLEGRTVIDLGRRGQAAADEIRALAKEVL